MKIVTEPLFRARLESVPVGVDSFDSALGDMISALETMTGMTFEVTDTPPGMPAIYIAARSGAYTLPPEIRSAANRLLGKQQAFLVYALPGQSIWVVADGWRGSMHGLYYLLQLLGVRYLLPGEAWSIVPTRLNILDMAVYETREPSFETIAWQPQFGYRIGPLGDVQGEAFHRWLRRNMRPIGHAFGARPENQPLGGHALSGYVAERRAALESDPLNFAKARDGHRVLPSEAYTVNYTYHGCGSSGAPHVCAAGELEDLTNYTAFGGIVQDFCNWLSPQLDAYQSHRNDAGYDPDAVPTFSVEPGDGQAPCYCDKCLGMLRNGAYGFPPGSPDSSVSDRVFHFANQIAGYAADVHPGCRINLFAYDTHVQVPSIPLHPSLMVSAALGAYADGSLYETRLEEWVTKAKNDGFDLGIYEYLALPAFGMNDPRENLSAFIARVRLWLKLGLRHVYAESTSSLGAVGLHWYVMLRLAWDSGLNTDDLVDEFWNDGFSNTQLSALVRRGFDRWGGIHHQLVNGEVGYLDHALEFSKLFQDLLDAGSIAVTMDDATRDRVVSIQAYAEYLRLLHNFRITTAPEQDAEAMLRHVFSTYGTLSTHAIGVFGVTSSDGALSQAFLNRWNPNLGTDWVARTNLHFPDAAELRNSMQLAMSDASAMYPPIQGLSNVFPFNESILVPISPDSPRTGNQDDNWMWGSEALSGHADYAFYISPATASQDGAITFLAGANTPVANIRLVLIKPGGFSQSMTFDLSHPDGMNGNLATRAFSFRCLGPGLYRIRVESRTDVVWHRWSYPDHLPFVRIGVFGRTMVTSALFPMYFYVPDTSMFLYYGDDPSGLGIVPTFKVNGTTRPSVPLGPSLYKIQVDTPDRRSVWSVEGVSGQYRLLGIPCLFARSPGQLLVSPELLP